MPTVTLKPEQQRVFNWLNQTLNAPTFADLYQCAVDMLSRKSPGHITVVAHTGRELMNGLPRVDGNIQSKHIQYKRLVDDFKDDWKNESKISITASSTAFDTKEIRQISEATCEKIDKLINDHEEGTKRSENLGTIFFNKFIDYERIKEENPINLWEDWKSAREWFNKHAHLRKQPFSVSASHEAQKCFEILDNLLYVAATSANERLRNAYEILEETNR